VGGAADIGAARYPPEGVDRPRRSALPFPAHECAIATARTACGPEATAIAWTPEGLSALRRVAALVAGGAPEREVFAAVTAEAARLLDADLTALVRFHDDDLMEMLAAWSVRADFVLQPGLMKPAGAGMRAMREAPGPRRFDALPPDAAFADLAAQVGVTATVAVPVKLGDVVWGTIFACFDTAERMRADAAERLAGFTELVSIALVEADRRAQLDRLIEEQAALRQVGALVVSGAPLAEVLDVIVGHARRLADTDMASVLRYREGWGEILASSGGGEHVRPGLRTPVTGEGTVPDVLRTGRPARIDDLGAVPGPWTAFGVSIGLAASAAAPILIEDRVWGALTVATGSGPLMPGVERRLASFAELAASAIAGAMAREELSTIAEEQAALRRVAELVARGAGQQEIFQAVATEASRIIDRKGITLMKAVGNHQHDVVAIHGGPVPAGTRVTIGPDDVGIVATIHRTRRPYREDAYQHLDGRAWARDDFGVGAGVGVPIILDDRVWGVLGVTVQDGRPLPDDAEHRLEQFAQLIAAALANAQARDALQQVAEEQAALRRVTELVARGVSGIEVLQAVTSEASALLGGASATLLRFEPGHDFVIISQANGPAPVGHVITYLPGSVADRVRQSGRGERIDDYAGEPDAEQAVALGVRSAVQVPVVVGGRVWGMLSATSADAPLPENTESRLGQFAELASTAIAAIENREQLQASRARLVTTADETRRRVQRDLHDGAQQRLVQSVISLKLAKRAVADGGGEGALEALIDEALTHAQGALADARDLSHGIMPGSLTRRGLPAGVEQLALGLPIAVDVALDVPRLPEPVETTAYFVVAEALTNVIKHADASRVAIVGGVEDDAFWVEVRDDGRGGVDPRAGSGLTGLRDRVEALGGTMAIAGAPGAGTTVRATLPLAMPAAAGEE
jgi:signal transduction histidine kinase